MYTHSDIQHRSGSDKPSGRGRKVLRESGVKIALIDGYRNARMVEKLGIKELARTSELKKGEIVRSSKPENMEAVKEFVK